MHQILPVCLFLVGVLHMMPVVGVFGVERLAALYGVSPDEPNLLLLMRHRAMLFGIIGGLMIWSAFTPALYDVATVIGIVSLLSFIVLAMITPSLNPLLSRIMLIDVVALFVLLIAGFFHHWLL